MPDGTLTVLLVEDNDLNRDMLTRRLERHGITSVCATDGAEGVRLAREVAPDVILMDISLPVMDGWEAIRQIRANQETAATPIIALTAHVLVEDRDKALAAGCGAFIGKPINLPELLATIRRLAPKGTAS